MAKEMRFDLVSPERRLASFEADEVLVPGSEGDITAMAGHMPLITILRPGIVRARGGDGDREFVVSGGFAEITATALSVLAERALPRDEVTADFLDALANDPGSDDPDATAKYTADIAALRTALGL
ncbi:MAG: F0F1 ATP synthase subunit epsilon [Rhodobacter sp.]|nr:F0F1 ATP synthase subunit epsilon [Rhodobacter sp.]MCY4241551.1 F0F1 ATP synthase subunit epsilon [Rhodobacter sp.]